MTNIIIEPADNDRDVGDKSKERRLRVNGQSHPNNLPLNFFIFFNFFCYFLYLFFLLSPQTPLEHFLCLFPLYDPPPLNILFIFYFPQKLPLEIFFIFENVGSIFKVGKVNTEQ